MRKITFCGIILLLLIIGNLVEARSLDEIKKSGEIRICLAGSAHEYYQEMGEVFARWLNVKASIKNLDSWDHQFHNATGKTEKDLSYSPALLKNGTCDFYPNDLVMNDWRKKKLAFVKLFQSQMVVSVHKDRFGEFAEIKDLKGKTAAVMKNSSYHNWIVTSNQSTLSNNPAQFVFLKTYDAWEAVRQKKADFTISNASGILKQLDGKAKDLRIAFSVGKTSDIGWALSKDDKDLLIVLEMFIKGQLRKRSEFDIIWQNRGMGLVEYMAFVKKLNNQNNSFNLSPEEKAYLKKHPVLKVHNEKDWPPFNYYQDGRPQGLSIDFMNLLSEKLGITVEYVTGPDWDQFLTMTKNKEIDVMLNIVKTEERSEYLLYTPSYARNPNIIVSLSNAPYETLAQLYGKTVTFPKGFYQGEALKKSYPNIKRLPMKDILASLKAVLFGKADAALGEIAVFQHIVSRNMLTGLSMSGEALIGDPDFANLRIAVHKDRPLLQTILTKAVLNISEAEKNQITTKWLMAETPEKKQIILTDDEKAWIAENPIWKVANELDWPPYDFAEDGVPKGYTIDLVNLALKEIGVQVEWINGYVWSELMDRFHAGDIDILPALYKTEERKKYIAYTYSYASNPSVLVTHSDNSNITSLDDLKDEKIASVLSYSISDQIAGSYPQIIRVSAKNPKEALQMVSDGRAKAFVGSIGTISYLLDRNYIPNVKIVGDSGLLKAEDTALHMGVLTGRGIQRDILQKGLNAISNVEMKKIEKRWLPLLQHQTGKQVDVNLSPEEQDWLLNHSSFTLGDDFAWRPFVFLNKEGIFSGIASGYINLITDRLGLTFKPQYGMSWTEVMAKIKDKSLDIVPAVSYSEERSTYLDFTKPYFRTPMVVATRNDGAFVDNLKDLSGKRVGVVKGYITQEKISKYYPDIIIVPLKNLSLGIQALDSREIDAFVDNLASITLELDRIKNQTIKIAAPTEFFFDLHIGVRKGLPELVGILNKIIDSIDDKERNRIKNTWMAIEVKMGWDLKQILTFALPIGTSAIIVIIIVTVWNRRLGQEISERKKAEIALKESNQKINEAHKKITDSIKFASMIQNALLPKEDVITKHFEDAFVIWEPKDVVGGDIFFFEELRSHNELLLFVIDCTGHGVPGAFVTALVKAVEEQVISLIKNEDFEINPAKILAFFNRKLKHLLKQESEDSISNAGFDGGVLYYNKKKKVVRFAGAETPLFLIQNQEIKIIKGNRHSIGYKKSNANYEFTDHTIDVDQETLLYLTTDGFLDQNGGKKGFPFGKKQFKQLLSDHYQKNFSEQKKIYMAAIKKYQGSEEKNDDMTFVGLKIV